ncbi:VOC family protein [Nesterenkonia muleiensis]|uniref:VOC family protein n=1 Tax=Nesterenkonia muleiensis TaxID=2282648 RepID=UPI000E76CE10|nr:VOC family protein [Nesterenkonia muleiensis]
MRVSLTSVFVDNQEAALTFYTETLGLVTKVDEPVGEHRWITVVSPEDPDGVELLLEPAAHPAVPPFREALAADGIPVAQFSVDNVQAEYHRLGSLGVKFTQRPTDMGAVMTAVFDDTCGNLIQIIAPAQ